MFTIPLDDREIRIPVNWPIIAPEAFSKPERQNFLDCMDSIPRMAALAKEAIRQEFSRRTLFRHRIRNKALRDFAATAADTVPGLEAGSCEDLLRILTLCAVDFGQGPCGEFCCELYFRFGPAGTPTLAAEFREPGRVSNFYFHNN